MKNLFSINKTTDKEINEPDDTLYLAARVSEEVRARMKNAFSVVEDEYAVHRPTEEEAALKKKMNRYWILAFSCLAGSMVLFFGGTRAELYTSTPFLHVIDGGLLIASLVFNFKARRISNERNRLGENNIQFDFTEASKQLEKAAAEAAKELGVPSSALSVDILPFHYVIKGGAIRSADKKGRYNVLSVSMYVRDDALCMATAQELFRVPLSEIRGYREYDEDFTIDMWLKPEESDSDRYKDFNLRKSGLMGRRGHGYVGIDIGGAYELLVPGYDAPAVIALLKIVPIA